MLISNEGINISNQFTSDLIKDYGSAVKQHNNNRESIAIRIFNENAIEGLRRFKSVLNSKFGYPLNFYYIAFARGRGKKFDYSDLERSFENIERITEINPVTGEVINQESELVIFPATHYAASNERLTRAMKGIEKELQTQLRQHWRLPSMESLVFLLQLRPTQFLLVRAPKEQVHSQDLPELQGLPPLKHTIEMILWHLHKFQ